MIDFFIAMFFFHPLQQQQEQRIPRKASSCPRVSPQQPSVQLLGLEHHGSIIMDQRDHREKKITSMDGHETTDI